MSVPLRVILADDHTIIRSGLRLVIERQAGLSVIGEAEDGKQAIELAASMMPDVIVMDVAMPRLNGIEATRQITIANPSAAIVVLSMHSDESYVLRALKAGARGYLLKDSAEADLIAAIHAVHDGKSFFSPAIRRVLAEDYVQELHRKGVEDRYELLTARERELLQLFAEGQANKDVANLLNLSLHTVETHRTRILQKLNIHGIPELILFAVRKGIIS
jgi:two-component system response regulator NreC